MKPRIVFRLGVLISLLLVQFLSGTPLGPRPAAAAACDWAQFVADVTVPDGTTFTPGTAFVKTWRLTNIGTCTWTTAYAAVFYSGNQLSAPASVALPTNVPPGGSVDISVNMVAPLGAGHYRSYWRLRNASGTQFGIGVSRTATFFVDLNVGGSSGGTSGVNVAYDFAANACAATWTSAAGTLPCPGTDGDTRGFVQALSAPRLESGGYDGNPAILASPQRVSGGNITGVYPAYTVQPGDHFQSIINCAYLAYGCYVNFRLEYVVGSGPIQTFWTFNERYDGLFYRADLNLAALAGQSVNFILYVADVPGRGNLAGDRAIWAGPRILRTASGPVPTSGPLPTIAPPPTVPPTSCNDLGIFVTDVTVPDGTTFAPGAGFVKTWRIKNAGTCTWTTAYSAVFDSGDAFGAPASVSLPGSVSPGTTVDISVNMTAPAAAGHYRSYWKLRSAAGTVFGLGTYKTGTFFADINVAGAPVPTATTGAATATVPAPTATSVVVVPTNTPVPTDPSNPPTATNTPVIAPPTATFTSLPPTSTSLPPTATSVIIPPTATFTKTPDLTGCAITRDSSVETQLLLLVNTERARVGLYPLVSNYYLEISAGWESDDMAIHNFLSHTGSDGSSFWDRAVRAGYPGKYGGEIIYYGWGPNTTAQTALTWWMNSAPHKAMILSTLDDFGAGYAYCPANQNHYYTVDFAKR